jgi:hypothetical protein
MSLGRALGAVGLVLVGMVAGFIVSGELVSARPAAAPDPNHPKDNYHQNDRPENPTGDYHVRTIHGGNWEDWCAEAYGDPTHPDGEGNNI